MRRTRILVLSTAFCLATPLLAQAPDGYYDTVDTVSSSVLRVTLHDVIDDHTRFPYTSSSTDTWDILNLADEDPNDTGRILDLYKNASYAKISGGVGAYNREHSWPKSIGFPDDGSSNYPYTDTHHLFAADASYNSSRSNNTFGDCTSGCTERPTEFNDGRGGGTGVFPGNSNWRDSSVWQTWSGRKGDVARAMFYMAIRYEGGVHGVTGISEPDLELTDDSSLIAASQTGNNESQAWMGSLSTLLQWHEDDPVDERELYRNEVIQSFQGNRNPFVDHPEWVACIWLAQCDDTGGGGGGTGGGGGSTGGLQNGVPVPDLSGSTGDETFYTVEIPTGASNLSIQTAGGSGDADLYVRYGAEPTTSTWDCRPYVGGNTETCSVAAPQAGTWHVMIRAYSTYSSLSLEASWTVDDGGSGGGSGGGGTGGGGTGGGDDALANGVAETGIAGAQNGSVSYTLEVPAGATDLSFAMAGGTGDADLYVRYGTAPTTSSYDCRPYRSGNSETCTFATPQAGTWHVTIRGYSAFSGVTLTPSFQEPAGGGGCAADSGTMTSLSGSQGQELRYTWEVPSCATRLTVRITGGSGDADLYVRHGSQPTTSSYDCRPWLGGNEEVCTFEPPDSGTWHLMVRGYSAFSGVTLEVDHE